MEKIALKELWRKINKNLVKDEENWWRESFSMFDLATDGGKEFGKESVVYDTIDINLIEL